MIKARIAEADPSDRRSEPRYPIDVEGKVRELGSEGAEARVLNISEKGFMANTPVGGGARRRCLSATSHPHKGPVMF